MTIIKIVIEFKGFQGSLTAMLSLPSGEHASSCLNLKLPLVDSFATLVSFPH
jgi:hypothetical protein